MGAWKEELVDAFSIMHGGVTTSMVDMLRAPPKLEKVRELKGFASSPGVVEGLARVVKSSDDIGKIRPGEILVCPHTTPAWTPAFAVIKGIVTNQGGIMSHAGIVAREYNIPAVLSTWLATSTIKTGDKIRVDGDKGVVSLLK